MSESPWPQNWFGEKADKTAKREALRIVYNPERQGEEGFPPESDAIYQLREAALQTLDSMVHKGQMSSEKANGIEDEIRNIKSNSSFGDAINIVRKYFDIEVFDSFDDSIEADGNGYEGIQSMKYLADTEERGKA